MPKPILHNESLQMSQRICFFIARYSHSGVPLAQLRLAKAFLQRGHKIDFVIGYVPLGLSLPADLGFEILNLNEPRTFKLLAPILGILRNNQPDVIFSAEDHLNAVVTMAVHLTGSRAKLSVSSRVSVSSWPKYPPRSVRGRSQEPPAGGFKPR